MAIHGMFNCLCAKNAAEALDFYARAFGTPEKFRLPEAGGRHRDGSHRSVLRGAQRVLRDPFGHRWNIGQIARKYPRKEMQKRDLMASGGS
ncbi:MAG: hypothetical protein OXH50_07720 [Gemmatimonadetes bacterium]|nr:hypothetical protein [Gemmatimonadota bacterium]